MEARYAKKKIYNQREKPLIEPASEEEQAEESEEKAENKQKEEEDKRRRGQGRRREDKDEEEDEDEEEDVEEENGDKGEEETPVFTKNDGLFSCPVQGCVSTFQRHSNLEYHMFYGKCRLLEERNTLLDKAKIIYEEKLSEGTTTQPFISSQPVSMPSTRVLPEGWALKMSRKAVRFNEHQKQYLDDKFRLGQETGHKADPTQVARDLRHAKSERGNRRFTVGEFLSPQQIQSYFSRAAAKLRQGGVEDTDGKNTQAIEDEKAYISARTQIVQECEIMHPIMYDTYNICQLYAADKLKRLSVALLRYICTYFNMEIDSLPERRKAPYITLLSDFVGSCSCCKK